MATFEYLVKLPGQPAETPGSEARSAGILVVPVMSVVVVVDDDVVVSDLTAPPAVRGRGGDPELQPAKMTDAATTTPRTMGARFMVSVLPGPTGT